MNHTTPRRLTAASVAPIKDGTPRVAPQPLGTWFTRWHHVYATEPVPAATTTVTPTLPRPSALTIAA